MSKVFDPTCRRCPRLAGFLDSVKAEHRDYYCKPVPPFGDPNATLLIVGLAPGKHGANRTGRPFTGDHAGILLYATLFKFGLSTGPISTAAGDGLKLKAARITNAVKCLPPENKPLPACDLRPKDFRFAHGALHRLDSERVLVDSYHCSRYNTQTRRLTTEMFEAVVRRARDIADTLPADGVTPAPGAMPAP